MNEYEQELFDALYSDEELEEKIRDYNAEIDDAIMERIKL